MYCWGFPYFATFWRRPQSLPRSSFLSSTRLEGHIQAVCQKKTNKKNLQLWWWRRLQGFFFFPFYWMRIELCQLQQMRMWIFALVALFYWMLWTSAILTSKGQNEHVCERGVENFIDVRSAHRRATKRDMKRTLCNLTLYVYTCTCVNMYSGLSWGPKRTKCSHNHLLFTF